jgi:hypothetical protein
MTRIELEGILTKTGAYAPATGVDISGITGDWSLKIEIQNLSCASGTPNARFTFEDSVDAFTNKLGGPAASVTAPIVSQAPVYKTFRKRDFPALRMGTGSATLRLNLSALGGTTPTITYIAWIEVA